MVVRWEFYDPIETETKVFEINPNAGGTPTYERTISYQSTLAPDGPTLVFAGRNQPLKISFSGVILTETEYDDMIEWFQKNYPIQLTDDLGREMIILITKFEPKRIRMASRQWRHDYSVEATILE
jgi:hypothetical protein